LQVRSVIRRHFEETLRPARGGSAEIAWSSARPEGEAVFAFLGLRYPAGVVKTRWTLARSGAGWSVQDVALSDPGVSLAAQAAGSLPPAPVPRRDRARQARVEALPRALGLAAIVLVVVLIGRRLAPPARRILLVAAAAPAILFLVDGALAVRRALREAYVIPDVLPSAPWRAAERDALAAQRSGRFDDARLAWERALSSGAPAAPVAYQLGIALRSAGRADEAKTAFRRALSERPPAPGAGKELALLALAEGQPSEARDRLERYLREAGPDPDALSALAVAQANLGQNARAVESIGEARLLLGDRWKGLRLEAQVYARAGDARKTVETLRALEAEGPLDRETLRSDPAYLPIATEPDWVAFLSETPLKKE